MTSPTAAVDTTTITRTAPTSNDGDHDRFSHYIKKDRFDGAILNGEEVEALCGKVWVPTRDPSRYPICPTCKDLFEAMIPE